MYFKKICLLLISEAVAIAVNEQFAGMHGCLYKIALVDNLLIFMVIFIG